MNQGVLYRYSPHAEVEEAQLVVPYSREKILKLHHDAPTAAHCGADGTFPEFPRNITGLVFCRPVPAQRFDSLAIDLLVPYQKRPKQATAKECAMTLINEVFLRYECPVRLLRDNGTPIRECGDATVMFCVDINQSFIPVFHPQANPVERKIGFETSAWQ
ncbi:pro-Pol polyprotein [Trichonephila clavipes]|nr:pro-Pol polyprotein [Trichonephila clavipes]